MNFESDELRLRKDLWTLICIKLIKEYTLKDQYRDKSEKKKDRETHRLYSETVKLLYDNSITMNIGVAGRKNKKNQNQSLDLEDPKTYLNQSGQTI